MPLRALYIIVQFHPLVSVKPHPVIGVATYTSHTAWYVCVCACSWWSTKCVIWNVRHVADEICLPVAVIGNRIHSVNITRRGIA